MCGSLLGPLSRQYQETLEKEMATHSSVLALRIPGTGEPGGLLSMGSHRVGHDWSDLAAAAADSTRKHWRRKWQTTPIFLLRKSQRQRNLVGYSPWDCKGLYSTEHTLTLRNICIFIFEMTSLYWYSMMFALPLAFLLHSTITCK